MMVSLYELAPCFVSHEKVAGPTGSRFEPVLGLVILRQLLLVEPVDDVAVGGTGVEVAAGDSVDGGARAVNVAYASLINGSTSGFSFSQF